MSTATSASPSAGGAAPMLPANATIEQAVEALKRDGYCILPNALPDDLCTKYLDCIKRYMKGEWPRSLENPFHGKKTHRFFDLLNADDVWQELPVQPKILGIAQRILGNDCQLTTYGTVSIGPGEPAQHIHTDDIVYKLNRPHGDLYMNIIFAISDFNERNGATHVLPGSNHLPYEPDSSQTYPTLQAIMPRGSALFVLGSTFHHGGANKTSEVRHGITMAYSAGYLRTMENFQMSVPQERAAKFNKELIKLIGWRLTNNGRLGMHFSSKIQGPLVHLTKL